MEVNTDQGLACWAYTSASVMFQLYRRVQGKTEKLELSSPCSSSDMNDWAHFFHHDFDFSLCLP